MILYMIGRFVCVFSSHDSLLTSDSLHTILLRSLAHDSLFTSDYLNDSFIFMCDSSHMILLFLLAHD